MQDIIIQPGHSYRREISANRTLALVVIDGKGRLVDEATMSKHYLEPKYFAVVHSEDEGAISIQTEGDSTLRIALIEVPAQVNYPLYKEGR